LPPLKDNNQLFFGAAKDYVMCATHIMNRPYRGYGNAMHSGLLG